MFRTNATESDSPAEGPFCDGSLRSNCRPAEALSVRRTHCEPDAMLQSQAVRPGPSGLVDLSVTPGDLVRQIHAAVVRRRLPVHSLARAAAYRDDETGNHVLRVGRYAAIIARRLGYPKQKLQILEQAARLHDIGKTGIPDAIVFKPGRLTPAEHALMQKHCSIGRQIIAPMLDNGGPDYRNPPAVGHDLRQAGLCPMLMLAAGIAQTHHEHWNGQGYPLGLHGEDIPLEGRIVAVADVFDALSSRRPYKPPFPREQCFEILSRQAGIQFDPDVIEAFFDCAREISDIQAQLTDDSGSDRTEFAVSAHELPVLFPAAGGRSTGFSHHNASFSSWASVSLRK